MARLAPIVFALSLALPLSPAFGQPVGPRSPAGLRPALVPPITLLISHSARTSFSERLGVGQAPERHRGRNALIGGLIGGAAGILACTVISNAIKDAGTGFSTCTAKGYVALGLGGAALGALIGALL